MNARHRKSLRAAVLLLATVAAPVGAGPSTSPGMPERVVEAAAAAGDLFHGGSNVVQRYGNWLGPGWWGGSELDSRAGMSAPVDDLDAAAQKHDFGYQLAEELGRGRPGVEGTYKLMADIIAIRDAMRLDTDPARWAHPPKDPVLAQTFVKRLVISFEAFQTRYNKFKSMEMGRTDITDLDTLNRVLDGLPDEAAFEAMQKQRVRQWDGQYAAFQAKKRAAATPAPEPAPAPKPAITTDCSKGSFLDQTLCKHDPSKEKR